MATNSPGSTDKAHAAQRMHVDVADAEGPRDVLDPDDRLGTCRSIRLRDHASEVAVAAATVLPPELRFARPMMTWSPGLSSLR